MVYWNLVNEPYRPDFAVILNNPQLIVAYYIKVNFLCIWLVHCRSSGVSALCPLPLGPRLMRWPLSEMGGPCGRGKKDKVTKWVLTLKAHTRSLDMSFLLAFHWPKPASFDPDFFFFLNEKQLHRCNTIANSGLHAVLGCFRETKGDKVESLLRRGSHSDRKISMPTDIIQ